MARMLGKFPPFQYCVYGCCTRWGPNRKTKHRLKRINKHRERRAVKREVREEQGG